MLVEGPRFVINALTTRTEVVAVVRTARRRSAPTLDKLVERHERFGGSVLTVGDDELRSITYSEDPQGVAAVIRQPWAELPSEQAAKRAVWLAFETLRSLGNLGTAIRTAAAAGARGVILLGPEIDPFDPAAVRATMGALFHQRIIRTDAERFAVWKRYTRSTVIGASAHGERDFRSARYKAPLVLMMGGERKGLSDQQNALVDYTVRIPMTGRVDSLNVAVAASLMVYEAMLGRVRSSTWT